MWPSRWASTGECCCPCSAHGPSSNMMALITLPSLPPSAMPSALVHAAHMDCRPTRRPKSPAGCGRCGGPAAPRLARLPRCRAARAATGPPPPRSAEGRRVIRGDKGHHAEESLYLLHRLWPRAWPRVGGRRGRWACQWHATGRGRWGSKRWRWSRDGARMEADCRPVYICCMDYDDLHWRGMPRAEGGRCWTTEASEWASTGGPARRNGRRASTPVPAGRSAPMPYRPARAPPPPRPRAGPG